MTMSERKIIELESGWQFIRKGIRKLKNILEIPELQFNSVEYNMFWTTIYNMCTQKPPHDYSQQLYDRYWESFDEYILEGIPEQQFNSLEYNMFCTTIYNMCTPKPPHDYSQQLYDRYRESFDEYILEGITEQQFNFVEYIMFSTTIYNMCTQKPPHDYSQQLYDRYRESFDEYITSKVLPALREKHDEFMLRELVKRWGNHKTMVKWLSRFFRYLDRYFIPRHSLPALNEVALMYFRDLVYQENKNNVRDAVITLIDREREGEQIDRALLKDVLGIFVEIGMGNMDAYENDFESAMLEDTASYYSRKAASWILEDSCPDYMLKAEECLKREKERVSHYLHSSSEQKLLEKVQNELLSRYESQLLEKEHSG